MLDDFSGVTLDFFRAILPDVDNYRIKARLADILWTLHRPRCFEDALTAIDAYILFPLDAKGLSQERKAWRRAILLAKQLKGGAVDRLASIKSYILNELTKAKCANGHHALWLAQLAMLTGLTAGESLTIANKLRFFGIHFDRKSSGHRARDYYQYSAELLNNVNNKEDIVRLKTLIAESFIAQGKQKQCDDSPSNIAAGHFFECALHELRTIENSQREKYGIEKMINDVYRMMQDANKKFLNEMMTIEIPIEKADELKNIAKDSVAGITFPEVLFELANMIPGAKESDHRETAEKILFKHPLSALFGASHYTHDGRIAARTPGVDLDCKDNPDTQARIWAEMIQDFVRLVNMTVQTMIIPALHIVRLEHRFSLDALFSICKESAIVPRDRVLLWAKGLYFGFDLDFISAIHILSPQVEHFVRRMLKNSGIKTTTLDSKGIETENGLSTLLDKPGVENCFPSDWLFELKALLTDSVGPNLRNDCAHGLLSSNQANSAEAVYFWWFCLRLVVNHLPWRSNS